MRPWERDDDQTPYPGDETAWFDSLGELLAHSAAYDDSLNEITGWEWHCADDLTQADYDSGYPETGEWLSITVAMPRWRKFEDWCAPVSEENEPAFRTWLDGQAAKRAKRWIIPPD